MNKGQRRTHRTTWLLIAVSIPVLIFIALNGRSFVDMNDFITSDLMEKGTSLVIEREGFSTAIVTENKRSQLLINLNQPLKHPSALVYTIDDNGNMDELLGQLQGVGTYSFDLPEAFSGILIYDKIKDVEIEKMVFSWD